MERIVMLVHEEDGRFGASFPDLPGCTTVAGSLDALVAKAPEAASFHLRGLLEDGAVPSGFRTLSELQRDATFRDDAADALIVLVEVEAPSRMVRVNISVDEGILRRIDHAASAAGETRSGFLVAAARARLQAAG